jgi:hypothetical protein
MKHLTSIGTTLCVVAWMTGLASADPPGVPAFFISMRAPDVETTTRFVTVTLSPSDPETSVSMTGCDGQTYYLQPSDSNQVKAALAYHNTVQLLSGAYGSSPQAAAVICQFNPAS